MSLVFRTNSVRTLAVGSAAACGLVVACSHAPGADIRHTDPDSQAMTMERNQATEELAIRKLVDGFVRSISTKDLAGVMAAFAPDVVSFDLGPPLQHGGGEAFAKRWRELFDSYEGTIDYEVRDLTISAGDDVAFSRSLNHVSGTLKNGQKAARWLRWTACYRKSGGKWLIVHEHVSVPSDVRNGTALLDLVP
jgi:uncharacterized protein (TIGR02246 family)